MNEKMGNLNETLTLIKEKIKKFRFLYEQNEMAVRDQLINPILKDLGWDPADPEDVLANASTDEGIPDYSLLKNGKKILFIEAKNLSKDIEQREVLRQLAKYSFGEGTKYGVLTNGAVWVLIRSFEEGTTLTERIVWKTDLENEENPAILRKITSISNPKTNPKTNIENIEVLVKKVQILDEIWQSLLDQPEEMIKGLMPVVKSIITQQYTDYQFEDMEIEDLLKERVKELISGEFDGESFSETTSEESTAPQGSQKFNRKMILQDQTIDIYYDWEILVNTANWLIKKNKLKPSDCPVCVGRGKTVLINNVEKHRDGSHFRASKKLCNGLYIEKHGSKSDLIDWSRRLLEKYGYPSNILKLND
ncbi:MAG: type I restriction endonuclease [Sedimentisphaerales bacterium]|jgi:hypothetical protein